MVTGRAVINQGVTVGDRAVIGSVAVVTDDMLLDVFVGDKPADVSGK